MVLALSLNTNEQVSTLLLRSSLAQHHPEPPIHRSSQSKCPLVSRSLVLGSPYLTRSITPFRLQAAGSSGLAGCPAEWRGITKLLTG
jgi:hypothetical protein